MHSCFWLHWIKMEALLPTVFTRCHSESYRTSIAEAFLFIHNTHSHTFKLNETNSNLLELKTLNSTFQDESNQRLLNSA